MAAPSASSIVPKPVPQSQVRDARGYQIDQIRRRFSPSESELDGGGTSLLFALKPTDPDFAYELERLRCDLRVPAAYPGQPPVLLVRNTEIPRGFGINIERGWDRLVRNKPGATLLALVTALDRSLEALLAEEKVDTVKLVAFGHVKDTRHLDAVSPNATNISTNPGPAAPTPIPVTPQEQVPAVFVREPTFSRDQVAEAKAKRAQEARQLEARMSRLPSYQRSSDGVVYTLPFEPRLRSSLPAPLQPVNTVQLIIPLLYPLQPLRIFLNPVASKDAEGIEELFTQRAAERSHMSLMSHVNYLAQNLHALAKQVAAKPATATQGLPTASDVQSPEEAAPGQANKPDQDRPHLHSIPRPPEWTHHGQGDHSDSSSDEDEDYDSDHDDDEGEGGGGGRVAPGGDEGGRTGSTSQTSELGTSLSFPSIELRGIELLQISILSISVKCDRCKTLNDLSAIKNNVEKQGSCKKCATAFAAKFRPDMVHQNSTRAGFIDASGCTVADLLPSTFVPTCAQCSTPFSQGLVAVRGDTTTNVCRECHARLSFKLPEVKLLAHAPGHRRPPPAAAAGGPGRQQREKLGLRAGEPLPDRGACSHYRRSFRWFRFSCCGRVHPCDRCHDVDEEDHHPIEWANRMICGWCSREQNYRVESCAFCGRSVVGSRAKGYWEGGKGTRNRVLMRRNDRRKHRRVGGGEAAKKGKGEGGGAG